MLNRWLDEGEGDGKIVRELDPLPNSSAATLALIRHKFLVHFHLFILSFSSSGIISFNMPEFHSNRYRFAGNEI